MGTTIPCLISKAEQKILTGGMCTVHNVCKCSTHGWLEMVTNICIINSVEIHISTMLCLHVYDYNSLDPIDSYNAIM